MPFFICSEWEKCDRQSATIKINRRLIITSNYHSWKPLFFAGETKYKVVCRLKDLNENENDALNSKQAHMTQQVKFTPACLCDDFIFTPQVDLWAKKRTLRDKYFDRTSSALQTKWATMPRIVIGHPGQLFIWEIFCFSLSGSIIWELIGYDESSCWVFSLIDRKDRKDRVYTELLNDERRCRNLAVKQAQPNLLPLV